MERRRRRRGAWISGCAAPMRRGTRAIRTHLDSLGPQTRISWPVFAEARERWRGRIELQASPLFPIDHVFDDGHMADVEAMIEAHGSKILGAVTYMIPRLREALDRLFRLAARKGWDLDFHVDETADPDARSLDAIAAGGDRAPLRRPHSRRPLLLAGAAGRGRNAARDRSRRARRARRRLAADVQHVPAGPQRGPHAALARRHRAARTEGGGRPDHDRQRQHARSLLRLWRSRHARSLARGRAHPSSRLSLRRLGRPRSSPRRRSPWASNRAS